MRFIDIIIGQVLTARARLGVELPLTLMNSFRTSEDTMKVLRHHRKFRQHDVPMEIVQHQEPKIVEATGSTHLRSGGSSTCSSPIPTTSAPAPRARWPSISRTQARRS